MCGGKVLHAIWRNQRGASLLEYTDRAYHLGRSALDYLSGRLDQHHVDQFPFQLGPVMARSAEHHDVRYRIYYVDGTSAADKLRETIAAHSADGLTTTALGQVVSVRPTTATAGSGIVLSLAWPASSDPRECTACSSHLDNAPRRDDGRLGFYVTP